MWKLMKEQATISPKHDQVLLLWKTQVPVVAKAFVP